MNGHPIREEDFDLYALGVLEGEEKSSLETHLADCADCARKLNEARGRIALLALAAPPHSPPGRVREKLLQQVRGEARPPAKESEPRAGFFGNWWAAVWAPATIVLAVLTVFLWVSNKQLNLQLQRLRDQVAEQAKKNLETQALLEFKTAPDTMKVALNPMPEMPKAWAQVEYNSRLGMIAYNGDMPMPPSDMTYQLWLVPASGSRVNAGVFWPQPGGKGASFMKQVPPGMAAKAFAVTVEPAGGMPQPTGPKVLIGAVT